MTRSDQATICGRAYQAAEGKTGTGNPGRTAQQAKSVFTLVMASDETYAMPLATAMRSVVEAKRSDYLLEVYVLSPGFSEDTRDAVGRSLPNGSAVIHWITADLAAFAGFSTSAHISKMTYARLLIPYIVPNDVPQALYLDADVLVLSDLKRLWETNLEGAVLGAVPDHIVGQRLRNGRVVLGESVQLERYFNAGVLLIDLHRWRQEGVSEKALAYLQAFPRSPFSDQDALNVVCAGRWKQLDEGWNYQNHFRTPFAKTGPQQAPDLIHFVTSSKPWDPHVRSINAAFYDSFRSQTCFARRTHEKLRDSVIRTACGFRNRFRRLVTGMRTWASAESKPSIALED